MDKVLEGLAPYYLHVSYVVRDIEAARESFMGLLGVKHIGVMELPMAAPLLMRGKPVEKPFRIKIGVGRVGTNGDQEIELIQPIPVGDDIYSQFLKASGSGIHHIAFLVPDWDKATVELRAAGVPRILESQNAEFHFAYFDLRDRIGTAVEVVQYDRQAFEMIENLKGPRQ
ncbi:MAG TPA: VOC family protein [Candidatus Binataceae bacterium]|jgi:catechol 2,3-dioxygenase-like lactoylglutathione lyase family enzyme|nr:VOC family protein [Candidatus Binataceae bacterium]